jgi:L-2-hydroxyglutarate oxidase LhgO
MAHETARTEVVVIGGGVVGVSVARHFAMRGIEVILIEQESRLGSATSARNSGVIHAGLYYPENSLKEKLCLRGKELLYRYCAQKGIPHKRIGKWIVSAPGQEKALEEIYLRAVSNGVPIRRLSGSSVRKESSELACTEALDSPTTGIIDVQHLIQSLSLDCERAGGIVHCGAKVASLRVDTGNALLLLEDGTQILADLAVNAAGLNALGLLLEDAPRDYTNLYLKGSYFAYSGAVPFRQLVYPIPADRGLGIHLTYDLTGAAKFGPNVFRVREPEFSVCDADLPEFVKAIRQYWPNLDPSKLRPDYSGVRPKLMCGNQVVDDYVFWGQRNGGKCSVLSLLGIDSPGLTSCLAIADHVFQLVA